MGCIFCGGEMSNHLTTGDFKIVKCVSCGIAITDPRPFMPVYEDLDFHNSPLPTEKNISKHLPDLPVQWQQLILAQVEMVCKSTHQGARVLEIGCGEGILLEEIIKKGFIVKGIEPSKSGAKRASLKGIDVYEGYFKPEVFSEKFDMVIMSHVLEHIELPDKAISGILSILKPNGCLMLTQTNYQGSIPLLLKEKWYAWVPGQHFWHFTIKGLSGWLKKSGLILKYKRHLSLVHPATWKYLPLNLWNSVFKSYTDQYIIVFGKSSENSKSK